MCQVYLAVPRAPDQLLDCERDDGGVYHRKFGFDELVGEVDLTSGSIYELRFDPARAVSRIELGSGMVFPSSLGPDEYINWVDDNDRMHQIAPMTADEYIGKIEPFVSCTHSAGGLLLLVMPALESN